MEAGDIVLYDRVFENREHDHIGIVIENRIEVRTLNLDGDFDSIKAQFYGIAEKYFGIRTA